MDPVGRAAGAVLAHAGAEVGGAGCGSARCGSAMRASWELVRAWCGDVQAEGGRLRHTGGSGPRMRVARACAGAVRQGRGGAGPADEEEEE
jgi:hypothetical protein